MYIIYLFIYLFICTLFNDDVTNSDSMTSNYWMIAYSVFKCMWKEPAVAQLKLIFRYFSGRTEKTTSVLSKHSKDHFMNWRQKS